MTDLAFHEQAWDDYEWWQGQDRKTLRRINRLIRAALRNPRTGEGQPEALVGDMAGLWSRRIDERNRLVYQIVEGGIVVTQCRGHYDNH